MMHNFRWSSFLLAASISHIALGSGMMVIPQSSPLQTPGDNLGTLEIFLPIDSEIQDVQDKINGFKTQLQKMNPDQRQKTLSLLGSVLSRQDDASYQLYAAFWVSNLQSILTPQELSLLQGIDVSTDAINNRGYAPPGTQSALQADGGVFGAAPMSSQVPNPQMSLYQPLASAVQPLSGTVPSAVPLGIDTSDSSMSPNASDPSALNPNTLDPDDDGSDSTAGGSGGGGSDLDDGSTGDDSDDDTDDGSPVNPGATTVAPLGASLPVASSVAPQQFSTVPTVPLAQQLPSVAQQLPSGAPQSASVTAAPQTAAQSSTVFATQPTTVSASTTILSLFVPGKPDSQLQQDIWNTLTQNTGSHEEFLILFIGIDYQPQKANMERLGIELVFDSNEKPQATYQGQTIPLVYNLDSLKQKFKDDKIYAGILQLKKQVEELFGMSLSDLDGSKTLSSQAGKASSSVPPSSSPSPSATPLLVGETGGENDF